MSALNDLLEMADKQISDLKSQKADLLAALEWIVEIADKNHDEDEKLRANGARTLSRISDKARAAILRAQGEA